MNRSAGRQRQEGLFLAFFPVVASNTNLSTFGSGAKVRNIFGKTGGSFKKIMRRKTGLSPV
jgi:hypothetical protein